VVIGNVLHLPSVAITIAGALLCFGLRLMAIHRGWRLPNARPPDRSDVRQQEDSDDNGSSRPS
jgi:uncharacterized membrane protein YeiH